MTRVGRPARRAGRVLATVLAAAVLQADGSASAPGAAVDRSASRADDSASRPSQQGQRQAWPVVRRYPAPEARQAVAVDATHFYAIQKPGDIIRRPFQNISVISIAERIFNFMFFVRLNSRASAAENNIALPNFSIAFAKYFYINFFPKIVSIV